MRRISLINTVASAVIPATAQAISSLILKIFSEKADSSNNLLIKRFSPARIMPSFATIPMQVGAWPTASIAYST